MTGSTAENPKTWSDLDLVVILDTNTAGLKSIYTTIDDRFADIFFFDIGFVQQLTKKREVSAMDLQGMFVTWLDKGRVEYDPDGVLKKLLAQIKKDPIALTVTQQEQHDFWVKINYNFIANVRYFESSDPVYHQALEIRLAYSVVELINAYFSFRGIPWRGEKAAIEYLQQHDPDYLKTFQSYTTSINLEQKMKTYQDLFRRTLHGEYQEWDENFVVPMSTKHQYDPALVGFWENLIGTKKS